MDFSRIGKCIPRYPHEYTSANQVFGLNKLNFRLPYLDVLDRQQYMMLLQKYKLTAEQMRCQGFPVWHKDNSATFFNTRKGKHHSHYEWEIVLQKFYNNPDPNFQTEDVEYVSAENSSSTDDGDSGIASTTSDSSSSGHEGKSPQTKMQPALKKDCTRCHKHFYLNAKTGDYIFEEECHYHWGKVKRGRYAGTWECCGAQEYSTGCTVASQHVWSGTLPGQNGPFYDYARTTVPYGCKWESNQGVFALDCEMVFTKKGMEVAKVSLVNLCGEVVYDTLVKPSAPVVDYNTRFSGLRPSDLANVSKTLTDVQADILSFVNSSTILMGHSLECDLRALKIVHMSVIDTSIVYPHSVGPPLRRSLKDLVRTELNKTIQDGEHDSVKDACAVVDLVIRKIQMDMKFMHRFESSAYAMYTARDA